MAGMAGRQGEVPHLRPAVADCRRTDKELTACLQK
jgi:hypothetical protein